MSDRPSSTNAPPATPRPKTLTGQVDAWMAEHPFHPRIVPFLVYVLLLMVMGWAREGGDLFGLSVPAVPTAAVGIQLLQIGVVSGLLWRYRRLMPEMTLSFHWLALPVGLLAAAAWMGLGYGMEQLHPRFEHAATPYFDDMPTATAWVAMTARLVGMAAVVPIFEELFFRSALLRSLHKPDTAKAAAMQFVDDLPVVGEYTMRTRLSRWADTFPRPLADAFERTPLGAVSAFAIISTLILWCLLSHITRDWPGTIACGLLFIWLVWQTNRGRLRLGLGPVIWAHGITNAVLWVYTLGTGDWRFL